jgi:hypothetical protein
LALFLQLGVSQELDPHPERDVSEMLACTAEDVSRIFCHARNESRSS